jgi:hypothetical protein
VTHQPTLAERRERERKVWLRGLAMSVVVHLLLLLFLARGGSFPTSPFSAAGPRALDDQAAEGAMVALQLAGGSPDRDRPPPTLLPAEEEPPEPPEEEVPDATPEVDDVTPDVPQPGVGDQGVDNEPQPTAGDPGTATGTGSGDGGTADEGLTRFIPPQPQGLFVPTLDTRLRGIEVRIWVFVSEQGRVLADSTRLEPPTSDRRFNTRLMQEAAQWRFRPARDAGAPIAAWFYYDLSTP